MIARGDRSWLFTTVCGVVMEASFHLAMTHPVALNGAVVLVTGANGGLGAEFVQQALDLGAAKVYATARTPRAWPDSRVVPLALDVTDPGSRSTVARRAARSSRP